MLPSEPGAEPLMIAGRAVSRGLLAATATSRCRLEECQSYCCSGGVYIHVRQVEDLLAHQDVIIPHLPPERQDPALWFDNVIEPDEDYPEAGDCMGTNTVPDPTHPAGKTCIFLLPGSRYCALQSAGIATGEHPWRYKPFYCALHPLEIIDGELKLADDNDLYQEGGNCQRASSTVIPLYELFDLETKMVLGDDGYAQLAAIAQK